MGVGDETTSKISARRKVRDKDPCSGAARLGWGGRECKLSVRCAGSGSGGQEQAVCGRAAGACSAQRPCVPTHFTCGRPSSLTGFFPGDLPAQELV